MTEKVDGKQLKLAIKALFSHILKKKAEGETNELLGEDDEYVCVSIALKKIPDKARVKPFRVQLKHSLYQDKSICLFTKDPHKHIKDKLEENPVQGVEKVIGVTKLRKNYRQYKDRRDLMATYDLFMADDRIVPMLPALIGKKFFDKKKHPVLVNLNKKDLTAELERARDSTYFYLPAGPACMVKMATTGFNPAHVFENIMNALDLVVDHIPQKWKNIQALYLRTPTSVALPFFNALPSDPPAATPTPTVATAKKPKSSEKSKAKKRKGLSAPLPPPASPASPKAVMVTAPAPAAKKQKTKTPAKSSAKKTPAKKTPAKSKTPVKSEEEEEAPPAKKQKTKTPAKSTKKATKAEAATKTPAKTTKTPAKTTKTPAKKPQTPAPATPAPAAPATPVSILKKPKTPAGKKAAKTPKAAATAAAPKTPKTPAQTPKAKKVATGTKSAKKSTKKSAKKSAK